MPYTTSWDSVSVWSSWISRRVGAKNMHVRSREHLVGRFLYMPYRTISHYHVNVRSTYYYCTQSMHFPILIKLWLWSDLPAHPFPNFSSISYFRQHVRGLLRMSRKLYVKLKRLASSIMSNFFKKKKDESGRHHWPFRALNSRSSRGSALFRCEKILDFATVALSFVCGKYYPIMD